MFTLFIIKVALKQVRLDLKKEGVSISVMREIQSLMDIEHQNIVRLFDVVVGRRIDRIFLVMEYCDQVCAQHLPSIIVCRIWLHCLTT